MEPAGQSALNIVHEVLEQLAGDKASQTACLVALKHSQDGQLKLSGGDSAGALPELLKAHEMFAGIPAAKSLLGIAKTDLAAAYGNLSHHREAITYARDAVAIIGGVRGLELTEAMARMTLANSYTLQGRGDEGKAEFSKARAILQRIPGSEQYLRALEHNERVAGEAGRSRPADSAPPPRVPLAVAALALLTVLLLLSATFRSCA